MKDLSGVTYLLLFLSFCGLIAGSIASNKGQKFFNGFLLGFLFGPLGILFSLFLKTHRTFCPFCKEELDPRATSCPFCEKEIPPEINNKTTQKPTMKEKFKGKKIIKCIDCNYEGPANLLIRKWEKQLLQLFLFLLCFWPGVFYTAYMRDKFYCPECESLKVQTLEYNKEDNN